MKLSRAWEDLPWTDKQLACWNDLRRFIINPGGRRSGKSHIGRAKLVKKASTFLDHPDGWFICAGPVLHQTVRIHWRAIKALSPPSLVARFYEADRIVRYINGAELGVVGMDAYERQEGRTIDGGLLDEFGAMKPLAWAQAIRPGMSTKDRLGWAHIIGRPRGLNHFHDLVQYAVENPKHYGYHQWTSEGIVDDQELADAKASMDEVLYRQEYLAEFCTFQGRAYYNFDRDLHLEDLKYDPTYPLLLAFDFNVEPGTCTIVQDRPYTGPNPAMDTEGNILHVIGEVHIPKSSNTQIVCRKVFADWSHHNGQVICYGDATGGGRRTSALHGNDWQIIKAELRHMNLTMSVPKANPEVRSRVNALNGALMSADGYVRVVIDRSCRFLIRDLEGVLVLEGTNGELDKVSDKRLTHTSDEFGYLVHRRASGAANRTVSTQVI